MLHDKLTISLYQVLSMHRANGTSQKPCDTLWCHTGSQDFSICTIADDSWFDSTEIA